MKTLRKVWNNANSQIIMLAVGLVVWFVVGRFATNFLTGVITGCAIAIFGMVIGIFFGTEKPIVTSALIVSVPALVVGALAGIGTMPGVIIGFVGLLTGIFGFVAWIGVYEQKSRRPAYITGFIIYFLITIFFG